MKDTCAYMCLGAWCNDDNIELFILYFSLFSATSLYTRVEVQFFSKYISSINIKLTPNKDPHIKHFSKRCYQDVIVPFIMNIFEYLVFLHSLCTDLKV